MEDSWVFWRPILEKVLTYTEACNMDFEDLLETNYAIDRYISLSQKGGK